MAAVRDAKCECGQNYPGFDTAGIFLRMGVSTLLKRVSKVSSGLRCFAPHYVLTWKFCIAPSSAGTWSWLRWLSEHLLV